MWVPKLLLTPITIRIFAPLTAKFGPKLAFLANIGVIGQFRPEADQKTMQTRCLGGLPLGGYQNVCFLPLKLEFWPKILSFWLLSWYYVLMSVRAFLPSHARGR